MNPTQSTAAAGAGGSRGKHREAATVILVRRTPELELYWVVRAPELAYLGGFHAFPGGGVSHRDAEIEVGGVPDEAERKRRAAAVRELFEETGVLLAAPESDSNKGNDETQRLAWREAMHRREKSFADVLQESGRRVDGTVLHPAGRWISPSFAPRGFDTYFYLALLPEGEVTQIDGGELVDGEWVRPEDALRRWTEGGILLATPVRRVLEKLRDYAGDLNSAEAEDLAEPLAQDPMAQGGEVSRIEIVPGAVLHPVPTRTLRPATHTNSLVWGDRDCLLIDPGSDSEEGIASTERLLSLLAEEGREVKAIVVTHHHDDHIAGIPAMRERLEVPVWTHPSLVDQVGADRALEDGEVIALASESGKPWHVEVHFTPGHTRDHVVYLERERGLLAAGDLISGLSTVVIDPPDGDLADYLVSLRRLTEMPMRILYPGHGPPTGGGRVHLEKLIQHREWRENKIREVFPADGASIEQLVPLVYDDVAPEQWPWAQRSLLAHLLALQKSAFVDLEGGSLAADELPRMDARWELVSKRESD